MSSILTGLMGVFTRETVITLPLAIIICESMFLDGLGRFSKDMSRRWLLWGPFIVLAGMVLASYGFDVSHVLNTRYASQSHQGEIVTAFNYFLTQSRVIMVYIRLLFWPVGLNFDYDVSLSNSSWGPAVMLGFFVIAVILFYAWYIKSKYPLVSFGIFWFFLTLSVESSIIPIAYVITEYRLYLPLFGFCLGFVSGMEILVKNKKIYTVLMGGIVLICAILTIQRNQVYKDEVNLWIDTIQKSPYKSRPYSNLGAAYIMRGEYQKALKYLNRAIELEPDDYVTLSDLTVVYMQVGDWDKAIAVDERLLRLKPSAPVYNNLGVVYRSKGDWDKAQQYFIKALEIKDTYQEVNLNLGGVYWHKGQVEQAIKIYLQALSSYPHASKAQYSLAQLYLQTKQFPQALAMAQRILNSNTNDPRELVIVGSNFAVRGYMGLAFKFFIKAQSIDYTCPEIYLESGKLMGILNRLDEAISIWQTGLKYSPNDIRFKDLIAKAFALKNPAGFANINSTRK